MKTCGIRRFSGFTLIELLVVVLIIGILAAIALPQYNKAVEKSRAAEAMEILRYMHQQRAIHRLAGGTGYTNEDFGIELSGEFTCQVANDGMTERCCNKDWCYDSNGLPYGTYCAGEDSPVAIRVNNQSGDLFDLNNPLYSLQYEECEEGLHPNHIVCYDSEEYCKMFKGVNNPVF